MINNNVRATGDNRQNSSGNFAAVGPLGRTSIIYPIVIPANSVNPVPCAGTTFYVTVATAPVEIRPIGGVFNTYTNGKGLRLKPENAFASLEVRNDNAFPVVVQLFVGFDEFIDNALILANTGQQLVAKPTYPVANAAAVVDIPDISGGEFTDLNGVAWFALQREAIYVFNPDSSATFYLGKFNATGPTDPAAAIIYPVTSLRYPSSGNFTINAGGGNINLIVSELYQAIPKLSQ